MNNITAIENLIKDPNLRKLESQFGGFNESEGRQRFSIQFNWGITE
ncbi:MAG: hypothetical protein KDI92_14805 [Xanthomonadales bacterium]|nr:hypothetical protein [Xanthomonadales bacterium]